jgi:2-dehydro-3-deoxyphosphogalactonate aldolase
LYEAGIKVVEVPLNSPDPFESIGTLARVFGGRMLVGAGTLTDATQVADVARAGGRLVVTPHADVSIVRAAKEAGLFAVPGFFNPTEAFALLKAGADAIKLFPAEVIGPPMLKALRAVLPKDAMVIPVGGIDAESIPAWKAAGAEGFGAGSSLYRPGDGSEAVLRKAMALLQPA